MHGGVISRHLSDFTALLYLDLMMTMALVTAAVHTSHSTLTECTLRTGFGGKQRPDKLGKSQVKHRVPTNAQAAAIKKNATACVLSASEAHREMQNVQQLAR